MKKRLAMITAIMLAAGTVLVGCGGPAASTDSSTAAKDEGGKSASEGSDSAMTLRLGTCSCGREFSG